MNYIKNMLYTVILLLIINTALTVNAQETKVSGVSASGDNSDIVAYDIPYRLNPGQDYAVTITMVNNGKNMWRRSENYYLKQYENFDNKFMSGAWGGNKVELPNDVFPGDKVAVVFKIVAPGTSGVYNFNWGMAKDAEFFGEITNNTINVGGDVSAPVTEYNGSNSEFVSILIPERMTAGEKYKVKVTMKNTGTTEWYPSSYNEYKMVPVLESSDITYPDWNVAPSYLSGSIAPGQLSDIEFYVTAPSNPGVYNLQWVMNRGDNYFGQKTNRVTVYVDGNKTITNYSKIYDATFVSQNVPNSMTFNEITNVSLVVSNTGSATWIQGKEQLVLIDPKMSAVTLNVWNAGYIQLPYNVEPGGNVTFNFEVKPKEAGWQYFQCSMMSDGGTLFGSPSKSVEVIVAQQK